MYTQALYDLPNVLLFQRGQCLSIGTFSHYAPLLDKVTQTHIIKEYT